MRADLLIRELLTERRDYERFSPSYDMMDRPRYEPMTLPSNSSKVNRTSSPLDADQSLSTREIAARRSYGLDGLGYPLKPALTAREKYLAQRSPDEYGDIGEPEDTDPEGEVEPEEVENRKRDRQRPFVPAVKSARIKRLLKNTGAYDGAFIRGEVGMSIPVDRTKSGAIKPSKKRTILLGGRDVDRPLAPKNKLKLK